MRNYSTLVFVFFTLFATSLDLWGQRLPRPKTKIVPPRRSARAPVLNTRPGNLHTFNFETLQKSTQRNIEQIQRLQRIIQKNISEQQYKRPVTPKAPLVFQESQTNYPIRFRNMNLGLLHRGETIMMGGAFDSQGLPLGYLVEEELQKHPVTVDKLHGAFPFYDVQRVLLMVTKKATKKHPRRTRFIDVNVKTGEVKFISSKPDVNVKTGKIKIISSK